MPPPPLRPPKNNFFQMLFFGHICDATETGGIPPVTTTNDTMPPMWRCQAALV